MNPFDAALRGAVVVLRDVYPGTEEERRFLCQDGPGCDWITEGTKISGTLLHSGKEFNITSLDILKLAEDQRGAFTPPRP